MTKLSAKPIFFCMVVLLALAGVSQAANDTGKGPSASSEASRLTDAIMVFNARNLQQPIGKHQSPLTEEEVMAAIRLTDRTECALASDALFASFKNIAQTHQLPPGAEFEVLTSIDPGGDFLFDVWYVRILMPKEDGGTYSFTIRNRIVRSRSVAEVAKKLEAVLQKTPPMPGRYRLEERLEELKKRAAKATLP